MTEQKKSFEYIVSPLQDGSQQKAKQTDEKPIKQQNALKRQH